MPEASGSTNDTAAPVDLARSALRGTFFAYVARYGGQALGFVSTIVLARTLSQEEFGLAGFALLTTSFLEVLRGFGIGAAVIYLGDEPGRRDTAFRLALGTGLLLCTATWAIAPLAASFFGDPRVTEMTRVVALGFPIAALSTVHRALLEKRLAFGRKLLPELGRGAGKAAVAIALALAGFGPWSIVWGQVAGALAETVLLWWAMPWRPGRRAARRHLGPLLGYGSRSAAVDLLGVLLLNVDYVIVGRIMGAAALGTYTVAFRVPELIVKQLSAVVGSVTFPLYAALRHDLDTLRSGYLQSLRFLGMVLSPMAVGLVLVAEPLISVLFGARWADAAPVMQALALYALVRGLTYGGGSMLRAVGRPGTLTVVSASQLAVLIPALWWSAATGNLVTVAWVQVGAVAVVSLVRLYLGGRYIGVTMARQLRELAPSLGATAAMTAVVAGLDSVVIGWSAPLRLVVLVGAGVASYAAALLALAGRDVRAAASKARRAMLPS